MHFYSRKTAMQKTLGILSIVCLLFSAALIALAEDDTMKLFEEEATVAVATQQKQKTEQAPSIVTVVTQADIERYGARDLADVLRNVPGFEFGLDVYSIAGLSFRGIWAHEGKSLLMINGITQNELGYGNYNFFGSIPASMIERVEIIRGPGSAVYGGFAEMDVINVITHQPEHLNGMRVSGNIGTVGDGGSSRSGTISYGSATEALRMAVHVSYGSEPLSEREYSDYFGNSVKLNQDTAYRQWQSVIAEATAKNFTVSYQRNSLTFGGQDSFFMIQQPVNGLYLERLNNTNDVFHADYKANISDRWTIQPLFEYTQNNTWNFVNPASANGNSEGSGAALYRYRSEVTALFKASESADLRFGVGSILDGVNSVDANGAPGLQLSANPNNLGSHVQIASTFGMLQYSQQIQAVGITAGGRYEATAFGDAFAPRAGLTYTHEAYNVKLLYGRAFRTPLPWEAYSTQFGFNGSLKPETADTTEIELGRKFGPHVTGKINAFFIDIHDPIVYLGNTNTYVNYGQEQSEGAEAELRADYVDYGGFTNFAYAVPGRGTSPQFVTQSKSQFLSSPPLKINLGMFHRISNFELSPSVTYLSQRAGQSSASANDPNNTLGTTEYPALFLANLNIIAHDVMKNLDVHLAAHNIFGAHYALIQAYYGDHAPLPAQDREIDCGATWHF